MYKIKCKDWRENNALIHADYYGRRGIVIDKEFRKVTISNPGTFRIDINEAIAGGISDARNSKIFNMFSLVNVGERSGIGLCDVYSAWKSYGYKQPEFKESVDPDRITLTLQIECAGANDNNGTNGGVNHGANEGDTEGCGVNSGTNEKYGANEINIIAYIKENPTASSSIVNIGSFYRNIRCATWNDFCTAVSYK